MMEVVIGELEIESVEKGKKKDEKVINIIEQIKKLELRY